MDPAEALQAVENALRLAVRDVLGDAWVTKANNVDDLIRKRDEDRARRDGAILSEDLLAYTELHQLTRIILSSWEDFKPVFDDKRRTEAWFHTLGDLRNAIAHSRQLLAFERDLIAGISGQLRNQVTIYRNSKSPARAHYPVIESVLDNFGRTGTTFRALTETNHPRVEVGEMLNFQCQGWDQRGRTLEWQWVLLGSDMMPLRISQPAIEGSSGTLHWQVTEADVGEYQELVVCLRARDARYHRIDPAGMFVGAPVAGFDDYKSFVYAVNPPLD